MTGTSRFNVATRLGRLREWLAQALWVLPALATVGALALSAVLSRIDWRIPGGPMGGLLTTGFPEGAQRVVQVVAGSAMATAGVVFSLTVVALQIAASQYSPRLPQQFLRDRGTQAVMALFVGTFTYSVAILRIIQTQQGMIGVPNLAVTVTFLLGLSMLGAVIYFIHHIIHSIRVEHIMRTLQDATLESIFRNHERRERADPTVDLPEIPDRAVPIVSPDSGILQRFDASALMHEAEQRDIVVRFVRLLGHQVVAGTPLAWAWSTDPDCKPPDAEALQPHVREVVQLGVERTLQADIAFGVAQLVDIALRASSPAVNDPQTAVSAVEHLAIICVELSQRRLGPRVFYDDTGHLRVAVPARSFHDYLALATAALRRDAGDNPAVIIALLRLLADVSRAAVEEGERDAVLEQLHLVVNAAERRVDEKADYDSIEQVATEVRLALDGAPPRMP